VRNYTNYSTINIVAIVRLKKSNYKDKRLYKGKPFSNKYIAINRGYIGINKY